MTTKEKTNKVIEVIEKSGLAKTTGIQVRDSFIPFLEQAQEWKKKASELVVTDISQVDEMKMAKEGRLALKRVRVEANKKRIELKAEGLRYNKAVQEAYNVIENEITPIEEHLQKQEDFKKEYEEKQRMEKQAAREKELEPYREYVPFGTDLGRIEDDEYAFLLGNVKQKKEDKDKADREAEKQRNKEAKDKAKVEAENKRLRKEAEAKDKELEELRAKVAPEKTQLSDSREGQIVGDAPSDTKPEHKAEEKKQPEQIDSIPHSDKDNLIRFADGIDSLILPVLTKEKSIKIGINAKGLLTKVSDFIREKVETL